MKTTIISHERHMDKHHTGFFLGVHLTKKVFNSQFNRRPPIFINIERRACRQTISSQTNRDLARQHFLQEGIKNNPNSADLYFQLSAYFFATGRYSRGYTFLENGLLLDAGKQYVLFNLFPDLKKVASINDLINQYTS